MKSFRLIGLTGTTGAGKSEVAEVFRESGYEVIYADFLAREIMNNPLVIQSLKTNFGEDIFKSDKLDRRTLAERAFKNIGTKKMLDSITHPFISTLFWGELKRLKGMGAKRIVFDAPQLFESGLDVLCDCIVAVIAHENIRLERISGRDGLTAKQAKERMSVQLTDEYFRENSDYIIENNGDMNSLRQAVIKIIKASEVQFGSDKKA